jgi:Peptidase family M49
MKITALLVFTGISLFACTSSVKLKQNGEMEKKVSQFASVKLTADISQLSVNQKEMLKLFFEASDVMDELYWKQSFGNKNNLLDTIKDIYLKRFVEINYGPWERLNDNAPIIKSFKEKPKGANFYPVDMTEEEFKALKDSSKTSQYTLIERDTNGELKSVPYHIAFKDELEKASKLIRQAATLADDKGLKKYLEMRADALLDDNYQASDMAWMDMKSNVLDFVVGPIETYEDQIFGYKASYEAYILLKDTSWSERLEKYTKLLPEMQKKLPVDAAYKSESPGSGSDLGAYDVLCYAGDCNAGTKTIAINLPNDEEVQLVKGSRRLQLKNAIKAKYDQILVPIANVLIDDNQIKHMSFDGFFNDIMFHEIAHGLGIKNTINGKGTVKLALKNQYSALEEGKADILGLFLITQLNEMGILKTDLMDNYVTFLAGLFRSVRFGASSAHGRANLIRFNYFREKGAFTRNQTGKYAVNFDEMKKAMNELSREILIIQGNGDYEAAKKLYDKYGVLTTELENDLAKLNTTNIPLDIVFEQGPTVLGLNN